MSDPGRGRPGDEGPRAPRHRLRPCIALLGPTGVGKTAVAVELARLLGTRVISCDSMQVYRGFPVLTNQPTAAESAEVRHELVGVVDADRAFSAAEYAELARPLVEQDLESAGAALVAGGTGLYMRAALAPLAVAAAADPVVRQRLEERAAAEGGGALHAELAGLDPAAAQAIDPRNVRRVIRALEAVMVSGTVWSGRDDLWSPRYYHPHGGRRSDARPAGTVSAHRREIGRDLRRRRRRGGAPLPRGSATWTLTSPGGAGIRSAIGYPEICAYLAGESSREQAVEHIAAATRQYARRQLTWLRKLEGAVMIDVGGREAGAVARQIRELGTDGV